MSKLNDFRKAVNLGKKNLEKVKTISEPLTTTFYVPDGKGIGQPHELTYCLKALTVKDTFDHFTMQTTYVDDVSVDVMTAEAAMVIVGVVDPKGKRIFSEDDATFLDSTLNTKPVLNVSIAIMSNAGVGQAGEIEVK